MSRLSIHFSLSRWIAAGLLLTFVLAGCRQLEVYEKNTSVPGQRWSAKQEIQGRFDIRDTVSPFRIQVVVRHTDAYAYNNIWLNVGLQAPGDTLRFQRVNVLLGDDARGWYGTGMNDIWEVRFPLTDVPRRFLRAGTYRFVIRQLMRDEPLEHVMSAGIRLDKSP